MLGHEHPAEEQTIELQPHFLEVLHEEMAEALGTENRHTAISAGGDELQFARAVDTMVYRHVGVEYKLGAYSDGRRRVSLRDIADFKKRSLRQPAKPDVCAGRNSSVLTMDRHA